MWKDRYDWLTPEAREELGCQRVSSPCAGLDAGSRVAKELDIPWEALHLYDIDDTLRPALEHLHGRSLAHCMGPIRGGMTMVRECDLGLAAEIHGLIAGPPCQPKSSCGKCAGTADKRMVPWEVLLSWICLFANHGLRWFIIEFCEAILKNELQNNVLALFSSTNVKVSCNDSCLPLLNELSQIFNQIDFASIC